MNMVFSKLIFLWHVVIRKPLCAKVDIIIILLLLNKYKKHARSLHPLYTDRTILLYMQEQLGQSIIDLFYERHGLGAAVGDQSYWPLPLGSQAEQGWMLLDAADNNIQKMSTCATEEQHGAVFRLMLVSQKKCTGSVPLGRLSRLCHVPNCLCDIRNVFVFLCSVRFDFYSCPRRIELRMHAAGCTCSTDQEPLARSLAAPIIYRPH